MFFVVNRGGENLNRSKELPTSIYCGCAKVDDCLGVTSDSDSDNDSSSSGWNTFQCELPSQNIIDRLLKEVLLKERLGKIQSLTESSKDKRLAVHAVVDEMNCQRDLNYCLYRFINNILQ